MITSHTSIRTASRASGRWGGIIAAALAVWLCGCGQSLTDQNTTNQVSTGEGVIYDRGGLTNPSAGDASNRAEWPLRPPAQ